MGHVKVSPADSKKLGKGPVFKHDLKSVTVNGMLKGKSYPPLCPISSVKDENFTPVFPS
jgi:hypothetical protein